MAVKKSVLVPDLSALHGCKLPERLSGMNFKNIPPPIVTGRGTFNILALFDPNVVLFVSDVQYKF